MWPSTLVQECPHLHCCTLSFAVRHLHACSVRSRFFILPRSQRPASGNSRASRGSQPTLNTLYQQLADSHALPADYTAGEAYSVAVSSCCKLLMLSGSGAAAAVTAGAELALLSSCGAGVGDLSLALQQHLLAPGSTCAEAVLEAVQEAVQDVQKHKLHQVLQEASCLPCQCLWAAKPSNSDGCTLYSVLASSTCTVNCNAHAQGQHMSWVHC